MVWDKLVKDSERFRQYEGQVVQVRKHLISHLGLPINALYVGWLSFATSCNQDIAGNRELYGWQGFPEHLGLEEDLFTIYNDNLADDLPREFPRKIHLISPKEFQRAIKLWDNYQRELKEGRHAQAAVAASAR